MKTLTLKERNVLIKLLDDYYDEIVNKSELTTSFQWTRGLIGMSFDDQINQMFNKKETEVNFSYDDYGQLRDKLYGDLND
jgi:hypothetical protein|tara:strand:+ start:436 stop:675 length:240 start_codon:yes stop_codon:yes gene_type:complete